MIGKLVKKLGKMFEKTVEKTVRFDEIQAIFEGKEPFDQKDYVEIIISLVKLIGTDDLYYIYSALKELEKAEVLKEVEEELSQFTFMFSEDLECGVNSGVREKKDQLTVNAPTFFKNEFNIKIVDREGHAAHQERMSKAFDRSVSKEERKKMSDDSDERQKKYREMFSSFIQGLKDEIQKKYEEFLKPEKTKFEMIKQVFEDLFIKEKASKGDPPPEIFFSYDLATDNATVQVNRTK